MGDISFNCLETWGSVRKVRYLADIKSAVEYVSENVGRKFDSNILRNVILLGRQKRLELIHKHFQSVFYTPIGRASLQTNKLRVTMPDTLTFLKNAGILEVNNGVVMRSRLAEQLRDKISENESRYIFVKALLESKYHAYGCFLRLLQTRGSIKIPKALAGRHKNLRNELRKQGVNTDVASFYTIRDLFYELGAINWYVDTEGNENIFSTVKITTENEISGWRYSFPIDGWRLLCHRRITSLLFMNALADSYFEITGDRVGVEASLISVRDSVCKRLEISDQQFRESLEEVRTSERRFTIKLSFGSVYEKKRNYGLKMTTLPSITSERLALYMRLGRNE